MKNRGAILVLVLLAAGLAAAIGAIWHQYRQTRRTLEFWGVAVARSIDRAPIVELIDLNRETSEGGESTDLMWQSSRAIDISQARGLVHFRRSLLEDVNFDWQAVAAAVSSGDWDYAVRFTDNDSSVVLSFDLDRGVVANCATGSSAVLLTERMSNGLMRFFDECINAAD